MNREKVYIGIDIGKEKIDVALHSSETQWSFSNNDRGITEAVKNILEASPALVVLEATGNLQANLVAALAIAGITPAVVNPRQIRDFAKATGRLAKTDAIDARVIAGMTLILLIVVPFKKNIFDRIKKIIFPLTAFLFLVLFVFSILNHVHLRITFSRVSTSHRWITHIFWPLAFWHRC